MQVAIVTAHTLLSELGFSLETKPLLNLVMALRDLDNGTVDPLLAPNETLQNRPSDPSSIWGVRAFLAAALEVRILLDRNRNVQDVARFVCQEAGNLHFHILIRLALALTSVRVWC